MSNRIKDFSSFSAWHHEWEELGAFRGSNLPDPERLISEVVAIWQAQIPEGWRRSEVDIPKRLLSNERYTRGNLDGNRRGEHRIEYEILVEHFERTRCFDRPLLDAVNAYPVVKDFSGGRLGDIEPDLVILVGPADSALLLVGDVKVTDGNPWSALVQNLRQLRLFTANPACSLLFSQSGVKATVAQNCGAVIAPKSFYSASGQKANSLHHARKLSETMLRTLSVRSELLVWNANVAQLERYV
jgi:hypothetical protein